MIRDTAHEGLRGGQQAAGLRLVGGTDLARVRRAARGSGPRTIAFTSGKGGVGKTQLAANVAVAAAQRGERVLLLDADLGLASLDFALGVTPRFDLLSVLDEGRAPAEILVEGPAGVHLLPACPGRAEAANLGAAERHRLLCAVEELAQSYDVLVIDTGAGIGSNAVGFAGFADEVVLVVTPDPTSLRDAYAMAKVLHKRSAVDELWMIANQVSSPEEGEDVHARLVSVVRQFLPVQVRYLGCLRRDDAVRRAVGAGQPFTVAQPQSPLTRSVRGMTARLLPSLPEEVPC
jgi:flagellar biosynthesis protein FlhG